MYWQATRSEMGERGTELEGDLSWTRRPVGIYTPIRSSGGELIHNRAEDARMTTFRVQRAPLEIVLEERTTVLFEEARGVTVVPRDLHSIPGRLVRGLPLLERYRVEAQVRMFTD